jgi:hypothetical protein
MLGFELSGKTKHTAKYVVTSNPSTNLTVGGIRQYASENCLSCETTP